MTAETPAAPILTTARLTLAGHRAEDLDAVAAMWADPAIYALIGGVPRSREDVWMRMLRSVGSWTLLGYGFWIVRETATGRFVGEIGLLDAQRAIEPAIDAPELGWAVASHAQGRGYAGEALAAILDWADASGFERTMCIIDPANAASIRVATRTHFRPLGTRQYHDRAINVYERDAAAVAAMVAKG